MKQSIFQVIENRRLTSNIFRMRLYGDVSKIEKPGQFINIKLEGSYLRRPISVYDVDPISLTIVYKVVGHGTETMSKLKSGAILDILSGLGNGFDITTAGDRPLLIGGGVGVPPLYLLAKKLIENGSKVSVVLGFNTISEVFCEDEFKSLGCEVTITTVDGSYGVKGYATDGLPKDYSYFYTCGPEPMLRAVYNTTNTSGQFSFEERMGCGFGACMGCSCKTVSGHKRICKEGPVLKKEEIIWGS
ncbi:MAG: dihydroorotate dehydrogenase electron transfer subunit [Eubacteriales bacterium]|jgi:dihydroorotate dehydrogenase electron transfer subunit